MLFVQNKPKWTRLYSFRDAYKQKTIDAASVKAALDLIEEDPIEAWEWSGRNVLNFIPAFGQNMCGARHSDMVKFTECLNEKANWS